MNADVSKAVFLSYASQDAEAAKRICAALRQAGVEVWFDQNELVGGDAWDAKIRKQIAECALFLPVISANTQARLEGYFRIEWKNAARRTHAMATAKAFLLPVVIDATRDAEAHVPDEFREVQWTWLSNGEAGEKFGARVRRLLDGDHALHSAHAAAGTSPDESRGRGPAPLLRKPSRAWLVVPAVGALIVALGLASFLWMRPKPGDETAPRSRVVEKSARPMKALPPELAALRARIVPETWTQADYDVMRPALDRFIQTNPDSAAAYALRSCISSIQVLRTFDFGTNMLQTGKADAERALRLDPRCALGELALGMHFAAMTTRGADIEEARPHMERGLAGLKSDALTFYAETAILAFGLQLDRAIRASKQQLLVEPDAKYPKWVIAIASFVDRKADEAQAWAEQSATSDVPGTVVRSYVTLCDVNFYLRADLATARTMLDRVPVSARSHHRIIYSRWLLALAERRPDDAIQELARTPDSILRDYVFHGPKALLAGIAQLGAGRPAPAAAQFREAERTLREMLSTDPDAESLRLALALTLAYAGRADDARVELAAIEPLLRNRQPFLYAGSAREQIAETYAALGDVEGLLPWLRLLLSEPSSVPYTSASFRLDPRFEKIARDARVQALLAEFTPLDARNTNDKSAPADKSVAVLAFANLSDDKGNEYFSDGISEELLNVLAKVPGLKVTARTSSFHFKGMNTAIPEIAQQLGVAYVVEGSVRKSGDKVRITAQLIKAADGFHVWSDTFTRDLKDIFAVQDEIAGLIAKNLQSKLGVTTRATAVVDAWAFELYMQGRAAWNRRNAEGFDRAEVLLRQALEIAPDFARAHAALGDVWMIRAVSEGKLSRYGQRTSPVIPLIEAEAKRALELDPESAEAYATLGFLRQLQNRPEEAIRLLRRSVELNPNYATGHHWLAGALDAQSWFEESLAEYRRAVEIDPLSPRILDNFGWTLAVLGRLPEALALFDRALILLPDEPQALAHKAITLARLGRRAEARVVAERVPDRYRLMVLSAAGEKAEIEAALRTAERRDRFQLLCSLGRHNEALTDLQPDDISLEDIQEFVFNPEFVPFHHDPRFRNLVAELGFDDVLARALAWRQAHPPETPEAKK